MYVYAYVNACFLLDIVCGIRFDACPVVKIPFEPPPMHVLQNGDITGLLQDKFMLNFESLGTLNPPLTLLTLSYDIYIYIYNNNNTNYYYIMCVYM